MRQRLLFLVILIVGLGLWAVSVQVHTQSLREKIAGLRARLEDFDRLETENVRLKGMITRQQTRNDELQQLRREARDVVRLRGEVTSLRNLQQENQELTTEIYQFSNQLQTAIQVANDWRNYRLLPGSGTLSNEQLTAAETGNLPQSPGLDPEPLPESVAPVPGSTLQSGQDLPAAAHMLGMMKSFMGQ